MQNSISYKRKDRFGRKFAMKKTRNATPGFQRLATVCYSNGNSGPVVVAERSRATAHRSWFTIHALFLFFVTSSTDGLGLIVKQIAAFQQPISCASRTTTRTTTTTKTTGDLGNKHQHQRQSGQRRILVHNQLECQASAASTLSSSSLLLAASSTALSASKTESENEATTTTACAKSFSSEGAHPHLPIADDRDYVWIWEDAKTIVGNDDDDYDGNNHEVGAGTWRQPGTSTVPQQIDRRLAETTTRIIRNWCENFVVELDLCPWAKASVQTKGAMRFFLVPPPPTLPPSIVTGDLGSTLTEKEEKLLFLLQEEQEKERNSKIIHDVAGRFQTEILDIQHDGDVDDGDGDDDDDDDDDND
uniref:Uncharacterized protein n=1 Tax=Pseudo-nitzschia australis TaxID=44445 RepID=A0A7S4AEW9_9STRA